MSSMESLESQVRALGLGHLNYVIGDPEASKPYALVIAKKAEIWTTFFVDERGLVEEQSVRTYGDQEAASADFIRLLRNMARIAEIDAELAARRRAAGQS
ncbi:MULTISPECIES: hypothetical protein [unclassified Frigoribacterium]|uniref:hypothetical protein n=1 Tax=unclassified Frigoribacterium TaxID=2627005 RepID=UPI0006F95B86|nr:MULTISPECIES: hypothetical protein [unclassified Frigoribacterium]KQO48353.1 hypothetical protein ASF07_13665 [Frigoribacterium sp. Leaf254]KQT40444.1 hypothetical protein ASG28_13670 [Frigoribacterium sp. Leaf415]